MASWPTNVTSCRRKMTLQKPRPAGERSKIDRPAQPDDPLSPTAVCRPTHGELYQALPLRVGFDRELKQPLQCF